MVEKLININIKELNEHSITGSCILAIYLFVWIKYNNKKHDIGLMQNMRNFDMNNLPSPQYSIKKTQSSKTY